MIINSAPLTQVRDLDRFRNQTVGFIFQTHNLIPTLTARENVEAPLYESYHRRARADALLALVGLGKRADFCPTSSRAASDRALANRPMIVLADEPTGNLDTQNTAEIMALLGDLNREQGTTLIIVTHNHEVAQATRRVITLRGGKIQSDIVMRSEFESELFDFKTSALGRAVLRDEGQPEEPRSLAPQLRALLERV